MNRFGLPYTLPEFLQMQAANTLAGRARSQAIRDIAEMAGRHRTAVREMANRLRKGTDVVLLERCRIEQAGSAIGLVADKRLPGDKSKRTFGFKRAPREAVGNRPSGVSAQDVVAESPPAHSGGDLIGKPGGA